LILRPRSSPRRGILGDLADRRLERLEHDVDAACTSSFSFLSALTARLAAAGRAAPGTTPSSTAARVALSASSTRSSSPSLDLGGARADHRDAASELGETLLELLAS